MKRDMQRAKLYQAEREAFPERRPDALADLDATVAYVRKVWRSPWTRREFTRALTWSVPEIADGRGTRIARGGLSRINLPRWARTESVILHEIAHALTPERPAHGREFARTFLRLVRHWLGVEAERRLRASFRKHHVRLRPKRRLTPEALTALRARGRALAAAMKKEGPDALESREA